MSHNSPIKHFAKTLFSESLTNIAIRLADLERRKEDASELSKRASIIRDIADLRIERLKARYNLSKLEADEQYQREFEKVEEDIARELRVVYDEEDGKENSCKGS